MGSEHLKSWCCVQLLPQGLWTLISGRDIHHPVDAVIKEQCPPSPLLQFGCSVILKTSSISGALVVEMLRIALSFRLHHYIDM